MASILLLISTTSGFLAWISDQFVLFYLIFNFNFSFLQSFTGSLHNT